MLDHREVVDLAFDQLARAFDQRAVGFERREQLEDAADVVDRRLAQRLEVFGRDHRADAVVREQFDQHAAIERERKDVRARTPPCSACTA